MKYVLKTVDTKFQITEEEYKSILNDIKSNKRFIFIKSLNQMIQVNAIMQVYPESQAAKIEENKNQQVGVLHDGILIKKHFGRWAYDEEKYSNAGYEIDITYPKPRDYPEIAKDCVATYKQFDKIKHLTEKERLKIILGEDKLVRAYFQQRIQVIAYLRTVSLILQPLWIAG